MTHLWSPGDPVEIITDPDGAPSAFGWHGAWHTVEHIANRWRVRTSWWLPEATAWREYFKLTTSDGLLCTLYHDLYDGNWCCARLYD